MLFGRNSAIIIGNVKTTGLRIVFDLEKNKRGPEANKGTINVYNLNETTRVLSQQPDTIVILEVGYGENFEQLFIGNISKSATKRQGANMVTILTVGDGEKAMREVHFDKSWEGKVSIKTCIKEVADTFRTAGGIIVGNLANVFASVDDKKEQSGLALSGMAKDVMADLVGKLNLEYSIQDNNFQLLQPDQGTQDDAILLTPQTGLLGTPAKRGDDGVEFVSLIIPGLGPGRLVTIHSEHIFETFKVTKATYRGDTHGQPWHITGWAKTIGHG